MLFTLQYLVQSFGNITYSANKTPTSSPTSPDIQPTNNTFFESTGGWDYTRIPLIEPYEAINTDKKTWIINLHTNSIRYEYSILPAKLNVINRQYIITYTPNTTLGGEPFDEVWFVIIPEEKIERGFTQESDFLTYLKDKGVESVELTEVNQLYQQLLEQGYLPWFPEKYKQN